uniref:Uncharacterized protein n=1 Tax=Anguilla anguilla TaxID=7936 RepID=A0A0E9VRV9_ANGAN
MVGRVALLHLHRMAVRF